MSGHKPNSARLKASFIPNATPMSLEEFAKKLYENNKDFVQNPNMYDANTSERVTPAAGERQHVGQQAEEDGTQLPGTSEEQP